MILTPYVLCKLPLLACHAAFCVAGISCRNMLQSITIQGWHLISAKLCMVFEFPQPFDCFCHLKKKSFSSFLSQALEAGSAQKNRLPTRHAIRLTPALFLQQSLPLLLTQACLLFLLVLTTLVEVLHHHSHKHVQHKEADDQQERDEVEEHPGVVIALRLQAWRTEG